MSLSETDSPIPGSVTYASRGRRLLAAMIDITVIPFLFVAVFLLLFPLLLNDWMLAWPNAINNATGLRLSAHWYWFVLGTGVGFFLLRVVLAFCSACCHLSCWKATPGGRLMHIQVVGHNMTDIGFWRAFARQFALSRSTAFLTCLMPTNYNLSGQGNHDHTYNTFVIYRDRHILNGPSQPEPHLSTWWMISIGLILLCGIGMSLRVGYWGFSVSRDWLDAKQTVLLHEHHELVELLTQYYRNHEHEACPTNKNIFTEETEKQTSGRFRYFREIQFTSSYKTCMLTAKLHTPWNSALDGTRMHYGISSNQTPSCDSYFQHESNACKISVHQYQRRYRLHRDDF